MKKSSFALLVMAYVLFLIIMFGRVAHSSHLDTGNVGRHFSAVCFKRDDAIQSAQMIVDGRVRNYIMFTRSNASSCYDIRLGQLPARLEVRLGGYVRRVEGEKGYADVFEASIRKGSVPVFVWVFHSTQES